MKNLVFSGPFIKIGAEACSSPRKCVESVDRLKTNYPVGSRVELRKMDDPYAPPVGTLGTVQGVDDAGSLLMNWDNGSGLSVVYGEDIVKKVSQDE